MENLDCKYYTKIGLHYLVNCIKEDGKFIYQINSQTGKISKSYNILRHSGCLYVLYQWLNLSVNKDMFFSLEPAVVFLTDCIKNPDINSDRNCVVENNEAKLGGAALALLAFTERYKIQSSLEQLNSMRRLAKFIVWMQEDSGKFKSKLLYAENIIANFESIYYPGEAILALIRLYQIDGNINWLNSAELGINYLLRNPVLNNDGTRGHNHWLAIALAEFYLLQMDTNVYNELWNIINSTIKSIENNYREGKGNFTYSSTEMSTRGEAILALLNLELKLGSNTKIEMLKNIVNDIIDYCLKFQVKENIIFNKVNLKGGIKRGLESSEVRIDYVQHLMQVLLLLPL